jgi:hypothetical protein
VLPRKGAKRDRIATKSANLQIGEIVTGSRIVRGKRIQFDDETWNALDLLARDRMMDFQELADEASATC